MQHSSHKEASPSAADLPADLDTAIARAGLELGALSHDLRVSREALWAWRKRGTVPRGDHLCKLADRLGLDPRAVLDLIAVSAQATVSEAA